MPNDHEPLSYEWMKDEHRRGAEALGWIVFIVAPFWLAWKAIQLVWTGLRCLLESPWMIWLLMIPVGITILAVAILAGGLDASYLRFALVAGIAITILSIYRNRRS